MTLALDVSYPTITYRYLCPEGTVFVKIARENGDVWIDAPVGRNGSVVNANSNALASLAGIALRHGAAAIRVASALKGITHEDSNPLAVKNGHGSIALSISDAIGDAILKELC